jgi:hypothetical protein
VEREHLLVLPDGKLLIAGRCQQAAVVTQIFRTTRDGLLDTSFGNGGAIAADLRVSHMALAPDGGFFIGGQAQCAATTNPPPFGDTRPPCYGSVPPGSPAIARYMGGATAAIEYYNATLDHYFISANPLEVKAIDGGVFKGWERTGQMFYVYGSRTTAPSNYMPVCRFYIPPGKGDSHFFSASATECDAVNRQSQSDPNYAGVIKESDAAFFVAQPDANTGACPANTLPVYRLWNRRADSNHRYTTDPAIRAQMIARGYVAEGYGPDGVAMCAARSD